MGRSRIPADNAVAESFFATLQTVLLDRYPWPSRDALRMAIFELIEVFSNRRRRHSHHGNLSPVSSRGGGASNSSRRRSQAHNLPRNWGHPRLRRRHHMDTLIRAECVQDTKRPCLLIPNQAAGQVMPASAFMAAMISLICGSTASVTVGGSVLGSKSRSPLGSVPVRPPRTPATSCAGTSALRSAPGSPARWRGSPARSKRHRRDLRRVHGDRLGLMSHGSRPRRPRSMAS
jgi:hypothetical protein